jgi:dephospho-CoA kinase
MPSEKRVVAIAGMPGSGKSLAINVALQKGYDVVVMGDEVREEVKRRSLPPTPDNIGRIMLEMRRTEGEAAIAKRCVPKIEKTMKTKVVVDGIRSLAEVDWFRKHFRKFTLIAVHSSPETRFRRLFYRERSDDPKNWEIFEERDLRELSVGLGNAIAMAEYVIVNEGELKSAKDDIKETLRKVESEWMK